MDFTMIQTAQNHTLIKKQYATPFKILPNAPSVNCQDAPGPPRAPQKVKKSSILKFCLIFFWGGGHLGNLGGLGASWQLIEGAFDNILKGAAY